MLRNGVDPLSGKSVKESLDDYKHIMPEKVISKKLENHRNKELFKS